MRERLIDLAIALAVLFTGIVLIFLGERDLGSMAVTTALGYVAGALREKPGGLDEAVRVGAVDIEYIDNEGEANAEVS
jgi:hypothetical protein